MWFARRVSYLDTPTLMCFASVPFESHVARLALGSAARRSSFVCVISFINISVLGVGDGSRATAAVVLSCCSDGCCVYWIVARDKAGRQAEDASIRGDMKDSTGMLWYSVMNYVSPLKGK